jgi:hypothetical protein
MGNLTTGVVATMPIFIQRLISRAGMKAMPIYQPLDPVAIQIINRVPKNLLNPFPKIYKTNNWWFGMWRN